MTRKTVLVTGASGLIGKNLIERLLRKNYNLNILVRDIDRLPHDFKENKRIKIVKGDLNSKSTLEKALDGVNVIFHLAATLRIFEKNKELYKTNIIGLKNILEVSGAEGRVIKFIFASSIDAQVRQTDYANSKLEGENLIKNFCKKNPHVRYIICRIGNVYKKNGEGFIEGIPHLVELNNWRSSILYHTLGNKSLYLIEMENLLNKLSAFILDEKAENKTHTLYDEKVTVKKLVDTFKKDGLVARIPGRVPFDTLILKFWQTTGKISRRGDLLIYLSLEK